MGGRRATWICGALGAGLLLGLGGATFDYAEGTSYLSTDPAACANCHIMQRAYDSWQKASHHAVARCVDCHLPHAFVGKYVAKAVNGWNHSAAFTLQRFPEPIRITPRNARILQESCLRCHGALTHALGIERADVGAGRGCMHCHGDVGHGERVGLGGPLRPEEMREIGGGIP